MHLCSRKHMFQTEADFGGILYKRCSQQFQKNSQKSNFIGVSIFIKVADLMSSTLLKRRLQHQFSPMGFIIFIGAVPFIEHLEWLFLFETLYKVCWSTAAEESFFRQICRCRILIKPHYLNNIKHGPTLRLFILQFYLLPVFSEAIDNRYLSKQVFNTGFLTVKFAKISRTPFSENTCSSCICVFSLITSFLKPCNFQHENVFNPVQTGLL